jgi:hypothetical protein
MAEISWGLYSRPVIGIFTLTSSAVPGTLDGIDCIFRVDHGLAFGGLAYHALAVLVKGHHGGA